MDSYLDFMRVDGAGGASGSSDFAHRFFGELRAPDEGDGWITVEIEGGLYSCGGHAIST